MSKPDTEDAPKIEVFVDGKRADTVGQAAARHGMERDSMTSAITRQKIPTLARLDGRTPLFDPDVLDAALAARRGPDWRKGQGYQPKPRRTRKPAPAEWVTIDPDICNGEPVITGTRVPAATVAELVRDGMKPAQVKALYSGVSAAAARGAAAWFEAGRPTA